MTYIVITFFSNRYSKRCGALPFYALISSLHVEPHQIPLEMRLLSKGKLRKETKKRTSANNDKLVKMWDDYKAGVLSGIDLQGGSSKGRQEKIIGWSSAKPS